MNNSNISDDPVFLNVRRAYRLLHDYQQMVIDAVRYISSQLDVSEWAALPHFAGDAVGGYRYLRHSSWDWLPMMSAVFHFKKEISDRNITGLSILILSDTGFIDRNGKGRDKEDTSTFERVAESKTKVAFFLYPDHPDAFSKTLLSRDQLENFLRTGTGLDSPIGGKLYDADHLCSESHLNTIIQDILAAAQELNLSLSRVKKI